MSKQRIWSGIFTLFLGGVGGVSFTILHIPIPWLLGPLTVVLLFSLWKPTLLYWPKSFKSIGMVLIGYTIGQSLTSDAMKSIGELLPYMFTMTTLLIILCAAIAWVIAKLGNINYRTALLSCIPGGMTQIIVMAEETKGVNLTVVTMTQTIRLLLIVVGMPIIVTTFFLNGESMSNGVDIKQISIENYWITTFILLICVGASFIGKKIKFPTAFLLVPVLVTALFQGFGVSGMELPTSALAFAQLFIGIYIALMMKPQQLENKTRILTLAISSGIILFAVAMLLGLFFAELKDLPKATALLSLAPGGMDQMGVVAHAVNAELSIVAGFQIFRAFFILFIIQPILAFSLRKLDA